MLGEFIFTFTWWICLLSKKNEKRQSPFEVDLFYGVKRSRASAVRRCLDDHITGVSAAIATKHSLWTHRLMIEAAV